MTAFAIAIVFIWIGFVLSISFFESWMKFRAPGVDLKTGLSIGKLIFTVLNRIEWVFAVSIFLSVFVLHQARAFYGLLILGAILALQSFWLLPHLNRRAVRIIGGEKLPSSKTHIYFIVLELVKLIVLFTMGVSLLNAFI